MKLKPRLKRMELLWALILLCLPAVTRADGTEFSFANARRGSSFSADITKRVFRDRTNFIVAATAGPLASEPSTGLLLLLGVGLIGAASLIGLKIERSNSVDGVESSGETAILAGPAWRHGGRRTRIIAQMSTKSKFGNYGSSHRETATEDRGQRHNALFGLTTK